VRWLLAEIRHLDGSKDQSIDFTAEDVFRATGVDVDSIDTDRVRAAVRLALDETPDSVQTPPIPVPPAAPARPAAPGAAAPPATIAPQPGHPGGGAGAP
jgi:hypothetical protein